MIKVDGARIELAGSDIVLEKELSYLIGTMQSRIASKGYDDRQVDAITGKAYTDAKLYTLEYLRSEAQMRVEAEGISRRREGRQVCTTG